MLRRFHKGHEKPNHEYRMFEICISDKILVFWLQESAGRGQATQKTHNKGVGQDVTKEENEMAINIGKMLREV